MEAVATGSAGTSGELMPLGFKFDFSILRPKVIDACAKNNYIFLGFGDAVVPGQPSCPVIRVHLHFLMSFSHCYFNPI